MRSIASGADRVPEDEVEFVKLSPTENMTVLVTSEHATARYPEIAASLMSYDHLHAEQVGFVRAPRSPIAHARLEMAGGEFCGNGCMALAAFDAFERGLPVGRSTAVRLETSGADDLVRCGVTRIDSRFRCRLTVPAPPSVRFERPVPGARAVVRFDDALHVVVERAGVHGDAVRDAEELARRLGATEPAASLVGVLIWDPGTHRLTPLVHVPRLDSMVWERGCGSGTAALGAYLAHTHRGPVATTVIQPGGSMQVSVAYERGTVTDIRVTGSVRVVARGQAYLPGPTGVGRV